MGWHKHFTAFLIVLLLASTFAAAFHHHNNTADDHDCPVCLVNHHQQATNQSTVAFDGVPFVTETIYAAAAPVITGTLLISFLNNRAPPV